MTVKITVYFLLFIELIFTQLLLGQADKIASNRIVNIDSFLIQKNRITGLPEQYFTPFSQAFAHYPELVSSRITFKQKHISTTMNVRPTLGTFLFSSRQNRRYIIRMNNSKRDSIVTLDEIPKDALTGIFGHELRHMLDYNDRNCWRILQMGWKYLNKANRIAYERSTDSLTVVRGMGVSLYKWSHFVLYESDATAKYKKFKLETYMKPEEIERLIKE